MSRRSLGLIIVALAVAGLAALVLRQRDGKRSTVHSPPPPKATPVVAVTPARDDEEEPEVEEAPRKPGDPVFVKTPEIIDPETDKPMIEPLPLQQGELGWETRIRGVLTREGLTEVQKGKALLDLLSSIQAEGAETCAEEAIRRLPNSEYRHGQSVVVNPSTYGLALGVLFADLMDRPDELRLPTLMTIARNSSHPYAEAARTNLDLLLGKDYGQDWPKWEAAVRQKLGSP